MAQRTITTTTTSDVHGSIPVESKNLDFFKENMPRTGNTKPKNAHDDSFTLKAIVASLEDERKNVNNTKMTILCANLVLQFINEFWHKVKHSQTKRDALVLSLEMISQGDGINDEVIGIVQNLVFRLKNNRWAEK